MKLFIKPSIIILALVSMCQITSAQRGTVINLPSRNTSTPDEVKNESAKGSPVGLPFISNDTFLSDPSSILGNVLVLRKSNPNSTEETPNFEFSGFQDINLGSNEYKFDRSVSSLVVNRTLSLNVSFLSFFSGQLTASNVLSMTVKNEMVQRVKDDAKWKAAYNNWRADSNNAKLFLDPNVTKILVVRGFVLKSFIYKNYSLVQGDAKGSYGLSVEGKGYSSSDANKIDYLWGIDYAIIFANEGTNISPALVHAPNDPSPSLKISINSVLSGLRVNRLEK